MPKLDTSTLGTRQVQRLVVEPITNEQTGMVSIRQAVKTETIVQPILTLEEAELLGDVQWEPFEPMRGHFKVIVNGRRFIIPPDVYKEMKKAPAKNARKD